MALMSPPIAVAASTAVSFSFGQYLSSVNVEVRFYTDAAGTAQMGTRGTGTRDLTAINTSTAYEGPFRNPVDTQTFVSDINGGSITAAVSERSYELALGGGMQNVTITAAPNVNAPGSATYRIIVDAPGGSEFA